MREKILATALLIRRAEEKLLEFFTTGQVHGTIHTCIGQEMVGACLASSLNKEDYVFSNHRGHGHYLSVTEDLKGLFGELLGKSVGAINGVGGSQHLHKGRFFSNGIQGGIVPLAAGTAWAQQLQKNQNISVVFIGDGTLGEGAIYEAMNLAAHWKLPLLIVLENNGYAQSTNQSETFCGNLQKRVEGFGFTYQEADTWNWESLVDMFSDQVAKLRSGSGPRFVSVRTYRLHAHSKGDDLRSKAEVLSYWEKDPLKILLDKKDPVAVRANQLAIARVNEILNEVLASAKSVPGVSRSEEPIVSTRQWKSKSNAVFVERLNQGLKEILENNSKILFIGEDVQDPYGGCFKVSKGLSEKFNHRVRNTPISESAISGLGTGAALAGHPCFVEFMFGDFSTLAFDQIVNHAAKFQQMYQDQKVPVIFRTPMGGGQGYGPTHSQNLEKHFLGIPGLHVFALNALTDPLEFLPYLTEKVQGPVLMIENKRLYSQKLIEKIPSVWDVSVDTSRWDVWLKPRAGTAQINLVGHGSYAELLVLAAEKLFFEHEILSSVFIATQLSDFSIQKDLASWQAIREHLLFEEGVGYVSFSSEVAAQLGAAGIKSSRWSSPSKIVPSAPTLEAEHRLTVEKVVAECLEVLS